MTNNRSICDVKYLVQSLKGKNVPIKVNKGRNKIVTLNATIDGVYPSLFIISPTSEVELDRKSYSYNEVLCGEIEFL